MPEAAGDHAARPLSARDVNDPAASERVVEAFRRSFFRRAGSQTGPTSASEDFGSFGDANGMCHRYSGSSGGTDPDVYAKAKAAGKINELPSTIARASRRSSIRRCRQAWRRSSSPPARGFVQASGRIDAARRQLTRRRCMYRPARDGQTACSLRSCWISWARSFSRSAGQLPASKRGLDMFGILVLSFVAGNFRRHHP